MNTDFDIFSGTREDKEGVTPTPQGKKLDDVLLSEELLQAYSSGARIEWVRQARNDDDFRHGAQWTQEEIDSLKEKGQFPIVVNMIYPTVEQAKALLTTNKPRFSSTGREDSDTRTGKIFADLMTYIWDVSDGNMELKQCIDDYYVRGMGAMLIYFDPNADFGKGEIFLKSIDPFDLYIDPNSKDRYCRDAAHIMIVKTMTREAVISCYPKLKEIINNCIPTEDERHPGSEYEGVEGQNLLKDFTDKTHLKYEIIDRYSKIKVKNFNVLNSSSGEERILSVEEFSQFLQEPAFIVRGEVGEPQYITDKEGVETYTQDYKQFGGSFHLERNPMDGSFYKAPGISSPSAVPNTGVQILPVTMEELIKTGVLLVQEILEDRILRVMSVGGQLLYRSILPIKDYPIVMFMNCHRRNPFPWSDVRFVRGLQEYINKIRSLIVAHASSATNVKLLIPRGAVNKAQIEREWAKAGTAVIEFDGDLGQPVVAGPIALPNELYKNEADARQDIQEILGIYALMQGDANAAPATYKGTVALDEYGQRRIKSKKDDIEGGLNQMAKVVVQLIQATYTEQKVIRLVKPNNPSEPVEINTPIYDDTTGRVKYILNDVTVGQYDVVVVSGSMLPSNRWAQLEYYTELYRMNIIDQVEVLKKSEVVDVEGVLNRASQIMRLQQMVEQLEQENKSLRGDLQTAQRESVHSEKKVILEKFKGNVQGLSSDMEASKTLFEERMKDELKNQKKSGKDE